ncbi:MAG TPA: enoyl-CoA hydratase/isomerase family protein, partial [Thermoplasmata archaeon]|nr:enoyl-CoA hydratase/isomerase family protein [Thermoplasmata archaeon]
MAKAHPTKVASPKGRDVLAPKAPEEVDFQDLLYEKRDGVAKITLNRPHVYNAYATGTLRELSCAVEDASVDDAVGVIVLTGAGDAAFCTGGDVREYAERYTQRPRDYWKYMGLFQGAVEGLLRCGKPTIARLNGITVGGGNELHLACDLSVAASHVYLGQVGVGVGSVACGGATQWLPLAVGDRRARTMLFLNERVSARQALEWGLVSEVAPSVRHGTKFVEQPSSEEIRLAQHGQK